MRYREGLQERKTHRLEGLSGIRLLKVAREFCSKKPSHICRTGSQLWSCRDVRNNCSGWGTVIPVSSPVKGILVVPRSVALRPMSLD